MKVLGIAGRSGVGKTTLLVALIPLLAARGVRVAALKQAHDSFDLDVPGRDSARLRRAGLACTLISAANQTVLIEEHAAPHEAGLAELLVRLEPVDLVLAEGFSAAAIPKLELLRAGAPAEPRHRHDPQVLAVVADFAPPADIRLPWLPLGDPAAIADFIEHSILEERRP